MRGRDLVGELRLTFNTDWVVDNMLGREKDGTDVGGDNTGTTGLTLLELLLSKCKLSKS